MESRFARLRRALERPVDPAGLGAFRILLGVILTVAPLRFILRGWVQELYVRPAFHFTYFGFDWVRPWPEPFMTLHLVLLAVLGLLVTLGLGARAAGILYCVAFTYAELIEKSAYLNHYYLVSLLTLLLAFVDSERALSLRSWLSARRSAQRSSGSAPPAVVPFGHYLLFRAQLAVVYLYAGACKLNPDWLLRGEPLHTWLRAHAEVPLLGPFVQSVPLALAMSWFGALFDLTIVVWLSFRRTRGPAYLTALGFHLTIFALFPVGIFSFVMLVGLCTYFDPAWPRRIAAKLAPEAARARGSATPAPLPRYWLPLAAVHLALQVALPLRFLLYPGHVNWTEQGFRFSWRVMLVEKAGQAEFHVTGQKTGRRFVVSPRSELTLLQSRQMETQPDMLLQYAHHLASLFERDLGEPVSVRVDSWVAWNGRPSHRLVDPQVDLAREPRTLGPSPWILPRPP